MKQVRHLANRQGRVKALANNKKQVVIDIPAFTPTESVFNGSARFTHFKLILIVASFNFESGQCKIEAELPEQPIPSDSKKTKPIKLTADIDIEDKPVVIIAFALEFYLSHNKDQYDAIASGGQDALGIIKVFRSE